MLAGLDDVLAYEVLMTEDDPLADLAEAFEEAVPEAVWHKRQPDLDAAGRIDAEVACRSCGYNLLGLPSDGHCPECGIDVERSALGDLLQFADPRWLRTIRQGLNWYLMAVFASIALPLMQLVYLAIASASDFRRSGDTAGAALVFMIVFFAVRLAIASAFLVGVWRLTYPDPEHQFEPAVSSRTLFRWGWCASFVLGLIGSVTAFAQPRIGVVVVLLALLPSAVSVIAMFVYLRGLALRIPARKLAAHTRRLMWGLIGCVCTGVLTMVVLFLAEGYVLRSAGRWPSWYTTLGYVGFAVIVLVLLALLVLAVLWVVMLFYYQSRLTKAYNLARRHRRQR